MGYLHIFFKILDLIELDLLSNFGKRTNGVKP